MPSLWIHQPRKRKLDPKKIAAIRAAHEKFPLSDNEFIVHLTAEATGWRCPVCNPILLRPIWLRQAWEHLGQYVVSSRAAEISAALQKTGKRETKPRKMLWIAPPKPVAPPVEPTVGVHEANGAAPMDPRVNVMLPPHLLVEIRRFKEHASRSGFIEAAVLEALAGDTVAILKRRRATKRRPATTR